MTDFVLVNQADHIFEITLNRPEKRNAIHWPMMVALNKAFEAVEKAEGARVVVIKGEGAGFSSGIDLMAFPEIADIFGSDWQNRMLSVTKAFQDVLNKVEECTLPTIALIRGYALGLGFELALACDFRIAARHAKIGLPETRLGLIPDVGGTTRLLRLVGPARAKEIILTGRILDLEDTERWGVVNEIVTSNQLEESGKALAEDIAQAAPLAVSYAKRVINELTDIERGLRLEAWAQNRLIQSEDFGIGVQAALSKTAPVWKGK
ncbi:MAG: enoyl-CoA hydratase/isomerase family protein [Anaerolineales bacterium]|jgi:enoyl-CoA hydratase/carnithine racemase